MTEATLKAIIGIRDNLNIIIDEVANEAKSTTVNAVAKEAPVPATTEKKSRKERESSEKIPESGENITAESLSGLSYNNLKKLAKSLGVSATGAREEIIERILGASDNATETAEAEEEEVETPVAEEVESDEDETDDAEDEDEGEEDSDEEESEEERVVRQVNEAVADMTNEEIMDVLADAGVRAKGKRQSLIDAVVKAVLNGDLSLDDDEEGEDESDDSEESNEEEAEEEFDPNDVNNPEMTEDRKEAIEAFIEDTRADFKSKALTRKEIIEWLNDFNGTKDTMKKKSDDELLDEYINASCLLIDDEGNVPEEEGAYTVNGVPYCCGRPLKLVDNTYVCEFCGAEYDADEE